MIYLFCPVSCCCKSFLVYLLILATINFIVFQNLKPFETHPKDTILLNSRSNLMVLNNEASAGVKRDCSSSTFYRIPFQNVNFKLRLLYSLVQRTHLVIVLRAISFINCKRVLLFFILFLLPDIVHFFCSFYSCFLFRFMAPQQISPFEFSVPHGDLAQFLHRRPFWLQPYPFIQIWHWH